MTSLAGYEGHARNIIYHHRGFQVDYTPPFKPTDTLTYDKEKMKFFDSWGKPFRIPPVTELVILKRAIRKGILTLK